MGSVVRAVIEAQESTKYFLVRLNERAGGDRPLVATKKRVSSERMGLFSWLRWPRATDQHDEVERRSVVRVAIEAQESTKYFLVQLNERAGGDSPLVATNERASSKDGAFSLVLRNLKP
jgi:hypothetical protein